MNYRIDILHKKNKEVYMVSKFLNHDGTITQNLFPGKVFNTRDEAIAAAENYRRLDA